MSSWKRWVKYGQARLRAALSEGNAELDRREAAREVELEDKPWLRSTSTDPTVDDVRARIEHDAAVADARRAAPDPAAAPGAAAETPSPPRTPGTARPPDMDFDLREQQRQADERLAAIRSELGLGDAAVGSPQDPAEKENGASQGAGTGGDGDGADADERGPEHPR